MKEKAGRLCKAAQIFEKPKRYATGGFIFKPCVSLVNGVQCILEKCQCKGKNIFQWLGLKYE